MAKCAFEFDLLQHVFLPCAAGEQQLQGMIADRQEFASSEPRYGVRYLVADEDGKIGIGIHVYSEAALIAAQPMMAMVAPKAAKGKR